MSVRSSSDDDPILGPAGFIFQTSVRARKGRAHGELPTEANRRDALSRLRRVTERRPEVMVKVTGSARGRKGIREHLSYITRNGKIPAERDRNEQVDGMADVLAVATEWWQGRGGTGTTNDPRRPHTARDTINIILSMPRGTDPKKLTQAAREFAAQEFGDKHDYLLVVHTDHTDPSGKTEQPHAHLTLQARGYAGTFLNPRKEDLQHWRDGFAHALRRQGVAAEASPRRARGVSRKGVRQSIKHLDGRRAARVTRWKIEQAIQTLRKGEGATPDSRPWEKALRQRQQKIRRAWSTLALALEGEGEIALALQVRAFVLAMPSLATERDELLQRANESLAEPRRDVEPRR
jgi:type IV secretion system T-DNA border endonuclease VirD2